MVMRRSSQSKLQNLRATWTLSELVWLVLLLAARPSRAQTFSVGVKAGVPVTEAYSATYFADGNSGTFQNRYLIGLTAEIRFPLNLSFEVDALYRRNGATAIGNVSGKSTLKDWQFPLLGSIS
jgi:hypothetical protein